MTQNTSKGANRSTPPKAQTKTPNPIQAHVLASLAERDYDEAELLEKLLKGTITKDEADELVSALAFASKDGMDAYSAVHRFCDEASPEEAFVHLSLFGFEAIAQHLEQKESNNHVAVHPFYDSEVLRSYINTLELLRGIALTRE